MREYDGEDHLSDWADRIRAAQPDAQASRLADYSKLESLGIDTSKLSPEVLAIVKWNLDHPKGIAKQSVEQAPPPEANAYTIVWPYTKWLAKRCKCCGRQGATGMYKCGFTNGEYIYFLCGACGLRGAYEKWNGFYSRKLVNLWLIATITYGDKQDG